jgi:hypothetical protein
MLSCYMIVLLLFSLVPQPRFYSDTRLMEGLNMFWGLKKSCDNYNIEIPQSLHKVENLPSDQLNDLQFCDTAIFN